jgi:hypothetical protein
MGERRSTLVWLGFLLHAIAWIVPTVRGMEPSNPVFSAHRLASWALDAPEWLPGWMAFRFAWNMLVGSDPPPAFGEGTTRVLGATCLTNVVMVFALLVTLFSSRNSSKHEQVMFGTLAFGCAVLNASWVYLTNHDTWKDLGAGYYLWVASFTLVGAGLLVGGLRRHDNRSLLDLADS